MTAAAANRLGLRCTVLLTADEAAEAPTGNVVLDLLLGPDIRWVGRLWATPTPRPRWRTRPPGRRRRGTPRTRSRSAARRRSGAQGYVLGGRRAGGPGGGLGGRAGARGHGRRVGRDPRRPGRRAWASFARVLGVDVGARADLPEALVRDGGGRRRAGRAPGPDRRAPVVDRDHVGPGYAVADRRRAGRPLGLAARCEGLVLDPVYTGKAMAALVTAARAGTLPDEGRRLPPHRRPARALRRGHGGLGPRRLTRPAAAPVRRAAGQTASSASR